MEVELRMVEISRLVAPRNFGGAEKFTVSSVKEYPTTMPVRLTPLSTTTCTISDTLAYRPQDQDSLREYSLRNTDDGNN